MLLNEFVDESDPDLDEPQTEHLLQTVEAIRRDYPNADWLHLTALIHAAIDLGKVLLHPEFGGEAQWCVVGDTFPLGCAFYEAIVHHRVSSNGYIDEEITEQDLVEVGAGNRRRLQMGKPKRAPATVLLWLLHQVGDVVNETDSSREQQRSFD